MPTHKVKGGYKWGKTGKVYPTKKQADKQGKAIYASGWRESVKGDIDKVISESVRKVLKEYDENTNDLYFDLLNILQFATGAQHACKNKNYPAVDEYINMLVNNLKEIIKNVMLNK